MMRPQVYSLFAGFTWLPVVALAGALNDTGQVRCYDDQSSVGEVAPATPNPTSEGFAGQDCSRGLDAAAALGYAVKQGRGSAGFDFGKIANDGSELPIDAVLGNAAGDWACTLDHRTGLTWEVKRQDGGLLDRSHTYTWFDSSAARNGGNVGNVGSNTCAGTLGSGQCNTEAYLAAVNALMGSARLCGETDWRLPTPKEMQSITHLGVEVGTHADVEFFPTLQEAPYWTGQTYAPNASGAWAFDFSTGALNGGDGKGNAYHLMLVRGGQ